MRQARRLRVTGERVHLTVELPEDAVLETRRKVGQSIMDVLGGCRSVRRVALRRMWWRV